MRNFLLVAFIVLWFGGCAKVVPSISEYKLHVETQESKFSAQGCKEKSLKVAQSFSAGVFTNLDILYGVGEHKQFRYTQSKWVQSPNSAIALEMVNFLKSSQLFRDVNVAKSRAKTDYVLETNIDDFMQYFSEDEKSSFVNVSITFTLIDTNKNTVLATKNFQTKLPAKSLDAEGGVVALNAALKEVLLQSGIWLNETCQ
jgi:cholesterol transport system auxiliary component